MNNGKNDFTSLGKKLEELKELFVVGGKIIPGIEKLVDFMTEIGPLLVNINNSIEESNAKIPKATDHIVDVTSATELATTEILDLIDAISSNTFELTHTFNDALSKEGEIKEILTELALLVTDNSEAKELVEKLSEKLVLEKAKAKTTEALDKILMDATNIAIALQVQDITTQQLAAVNHLILSVQKKLSSLMFDFSDDEVKQVDNSKGVVVPEEGNFDMNASFHNQVSSQDDIDKMIIESNNTSQDDIDKLFG